MRNRKYKLEGAWVDGYAPTHAVFNAHHLDQLKEDCEAIQELLNSDVVVDDAKIEIVSRWCMNYHGDACTFYSRGRQADLSKGRYEYFSSCEVRLCFDSNNGPQGFYILFREGESELQLDFLPEEL